MSRVVSYESDARIATITICRPDKLNAINPQTTAELEAAWQRFERSDDKVAILTGEGSRAFSAGGDLQDRPFPYGYGYVPGIGVPVSKPIIAAVRGWCVGVGLTLVLQSDLCVASEGARFRYPEATMGGGRGLLAGIAGRVPHKVASELILMGQTMEAGQLMAHGFVNRVVVDEEVMPTARDMAQRLASVDVEVLQFYKSGILAVLPKSPAEVSEHNRWASDRLPGNRQFFSGS